MNSADFSVEDLSAAYGRVIAAHNRVEIPEEEHDELVRVSALMRAALDLLMKTKHPEQLRGAIGGLDTINRILLGHRHAHEAVVLTTLPNMKHRGDGTLHDDMAA